MASIPQRLLSDADEANSNRVACGAAVAGDGDHVLKIVDHEVEIAVAIEISEGGAEADAELKSSPQLLADVFEMQVASDCGRRSCVP